jgi:glycolate oxidase iron-sulfur subunit
VRTLIHELIKDTKEGRDAEAILRNCVHCGFCNATCPTFRLLGDERDGPRGRIYLIKNVLEQNRATRETQLHLDRCLTCRSCETTCPSGVQYGRLLDIGRALVEERVPRPATERLQREALLKIIPKPERLRPLLKLAAFAKPLLPGALRKAVPDRLPSRQDWPNVEHDRKVALLEGCVQSVTNPDINLATARVLDRLGVQALPATGCCGALSHHMSHEEQALETARRNIDHWWPMVEAGAEAVLLTATGCAPMVADYGALLAHDPGYAERAEKLASLSMDISQYLERQDLGVFQRGKRPARPIAFHAPCSLQHGLKRSGRVEALLRDLGFDLVSVRDPHLCCGSAGSYSILQEDLSKQLLQDKISKLEENRPDLIATANIGCLVQLQSATKLTVCHWIELLDT